MNEAAITVTDHDRSRTVVIAGHGQVELAVAVKIGNVKGDDANACAIADGRLQSSISITEQHHRRLAVSGSDYDIGVGIVVQIGYLDEAKARHVVVNSRLKSPIAIPQQHTHAAGRVGATICVRDHQIQLPVLVEIAYVNSIRPRISWIGHAILKGAVTLVDEYHDVIAEGAGDGEVGISVAVEVADGAALWIVSRVVFDGR